VNSETKRFPRVLLATCPIPWNADGRWNAALFRRTVRHLVKTLTPHVYIFGTAGEGYAVTERQFRAITRVFVDEMNRCGGTPMLGVITLSLATMLERIAFAHALGVREFQISLPSWGALDDTELDRFFAAVCARFPDTRLLHYNLARARRVLTGADYARLSGKHPNLVAVKMGGEDLEALTEVARAAPSLRCFFTEFAFISLRDTLDCGLLCALGVCDPVLARLLFDGSEPERRRLEPVFRGIHRSVKAALAGGAHMDGAYDKMYVKLHFPEFPLRLLPPYSSGNDDQFAHFRAGCREARSSLPPVELSHV
jgi:dihydrodipicolinate synthase/N-acetylneuraminate lyase